MVVGIGEILTFNRKSTIFVGLLFAVIFITLIMVPSQADDDDSINKVSNQIAVDAVYPENTIGAQSDTYFNKVDQLLTVRHVNRGGVLNIGLSNSQDLTAPVITDFKVEPNTSISINNPAIASAYVEDENPFYIVFEFIDLNNLIDTDTMLLWYHINYSGINDMYFSPPWYANAWIITNETVDDIVTTVTDADWPDNIIILGNFTQNATSEEEEALLWFNISKGNLNNVTRDDTVLTPLTIESGVSTFKVFNIKFDIPEDFEEGPTYTLYTIKNENNPYLVSTHVSTGTYEVGVFAEDNNSKNCSDWTEVEVDGMWPIINSVTLNTTTPNAGDDILITVNATDNVAVTSVEANSIALTHQGGDIWNGSITAQPDYHVIYVTAIDAAGLIDWNYSVAYFANNTPIGTDVQVEIPEIGATITFENVIKSGQTYTSEFNDDPSPPEGYNVLSNYYDIVTTAEYTGDITICIDYDDSEAVDEDKIKILHYKEMEDETEIFALMKNISDTVWYLNATTYPDVLYEGSSESLYFVTTPGLKIEESSFYYNTSIYSKDGEPFIAWLDESMLVVVSESSEIFIAETLIYETNEDTHSIICRKTMHLDEGFAITLLEIDVDGEKALIAITKDGEEVESSVVREGEVFIYKEDLTGNGDVDNWVLKFSLDTVIVGENLNLINISGLKLISPAILEIKNNDDDLVDGYVIRVSSNTIYLELDDEDISLIEGEVVNLIDDKFRFKVDEEGDTGGVLKRPGIIGQWNDVTSSLDTSANIICGVVTNLSDFIIAEPLEVDNTPPNVTITSPVNNSIVYTPNITVLGYATDNIGINSSLFEHECQQGGSGGGGCGAFPFPTNISFNQSVTLCEGWNKLSFYFTDIEGNNGSASIIVSYINDSIPPIASAVIEYSKGNAANNGSIITINVSANDNVNGSGIKNVTADISAVGDLGTISLDCTQDFWIANIPVFAHDGNHVVNIIVVDNASNVNYTDINVTMDNTPPIVNNVMAQPGLININGTTNITAIISDLDTDKVSSEITYPNGTSIICSMTNTGTTYYLNFNDTEKPGCYNVNIIANDTTGNVNDIKCTSFIVAHIYTNNSIDIPANNSTIIEIPDMDITMELFADTNVTGSINISRSIVNITDELDVPGPGIYIRIDASSDFSNLSWALLKVQYTDEDVNDLEESSLRLYWFNESSSQWIKLETGSPPWVYGSGVDTVNNYVLANVSHFSDYAVGGELEQETPPSGNGGNGGGGGGASGELYENIACSETDRQYVNQNSDISYSFELECNIVQFVKFTSLKSAGQVATKVEILKDTSTLVNNPPSDIVYKNLNLWVGNAGWATKRNIADATVVFTVDKSWITKNNIDESSIALYRYSDNTWHKLVTEKIAEDANSLQFEAETPGFSPFAVTGKTMGEPGGEGIIEPTVTAEKTPTPTPTEEKGIPGFSLFAGLSVLLIAVQLLRKKE